MIGIIALRLSVAHRRTGRFKTHFRLRLQRIVRAHLAKGCNDLFLVFLNARKEGRAKVFFRQDRFELMRLRIYVLSQAG